MERKCPHCVNSILGLRRPKNRDAFYACGKCPYEEPWGDKFDDHGWLHGEYAGKGRSIKNLAKEVGISKKEMKERLIKHGLKNPEKEKTERNKKIKIAIKDFIVYVLPALSFIYLLIVMLWG